MEAGVSDLGSHRCFDLVGCFNIEDLTYSYQKCDKSWNVPCVHWTLLSVVLLDGEEW
jgi:hypothetical protein